jgi:hypothetical protein
MDKDPKEQILWHQSGINPRGEPFVQLLLNEDVIGQMTPTEARDHARALTEAAEAAEQDAFFINFLQKKVGLGIAAAGQILIDFRNSRAEHTGKSQGPRHARDWVMPLKDEMPYYGDITKKDPGPKG